MKFCTVLLTGMALLGSFSAWSSTPDRQPMMDSKADRSSNVQVVDEKIPYDPNMTFQELESLLSEKYKDREKVLDLSFYEIFEDAGLPDLFKKGGDYSGMCLRDFPNYMFGEDTTLGWYADFLRSKPY